MLCMLITIVISVLFSAGLATNYAISISQQEQYETASEPAPEPGPKPTQAQDESTPECLHNFVLDPTSGKCDPTKGPCPAGEIRGDSGFCAVMPEECSPGKYIDEDPLCQPCPTEGQIPDDCIQSENKAAQSEPQPEPQTSELTQSSQEILLKQEYRTTTILM
jgi:hypothetical protein